MPAQNKLRVRLDVSPLEDRTVPATFASFLPDRTALPQVTQLTPSGSTAQVLTVFDASYTGGLWVARADVTGDGTADHIAAAGPGIVPAVAVFDGIDGSLLRSFAAYETTFTGGVVVATADLNGDGRSEVITGTDRGGGPRVRIFDGLDNRVIADFFAIDDPNFRGGVRVSAGDVNGDGTPEVIAAAGFGGGPRVAVFDGAALLGGTLSRVVPDFFAFEPGLRNGVYVSAGDLNIDGRADIVFGGGPGGAPRVLAVSGANLLSFGSVAAIASPLANFFAGPVGDRGGVRVGVVALSTTQQGIIGVDGSGSAATVYNATTANLAGTIDRELALSAGLLNDSTGQPVPITITSPTGGIGTGTGAV